MKRRTRAGAAHPVSYGGIYIHKHGMFCLTNADPIKHNSDKLLLCVTLLLSTTNQQGLSSGRTGSIGRKHQTQQMFYVSLKVKVCSAFL